MGLSRIWIYCSTGFGASEALAQRVIWNMVPFRRKTQVFSHSKYAGGRTDLAESCDLWSV